MMRRLAPKTAMTVAEYFRDRGQSVLLIIDSVTRFAHAARDVALAAGEPAVARGYAPSVFSDLPRLLERAGPGVEGSGSITGIFSVLVDGDDHNDPVADNIRGTLDGHIVLDRAIADQGRYPAVNILSSISRLAQPRWTPEQSALVDAAARADRALRGDARTQVDGRLHAGQRSGAGSGGQDRAAHLRSMTQTAAIAAEPGPIHGSGGRVARSGARRRGRRLRRNEARAMAKVPVPLKTIAHTLHGAQHSGAGQLVAAKLVDVLPIGSSVAAAAGVGRLRRLRW